MNKATHGMFGDCHSSRCRSLVGIPLTPQQDSRPAVMGQALAPRSAREVTPLHRVRAYGPLGWARGWLVPVKRTTGRSGQDRIRTGVRPP